MNKSVMLVGNTGVVGGNLALNSDFTSMYHRINIGHAYGKKPDILVYAGVTGTKFMANKYPDKDKGVIDSAIENIKKIMPKKLVLISTVDVLDQFGKDEDYMPIESKFGAYGNHRLYLENWVKENIKDYHIVRLPAVYGRGLRKNFIYDLIHIIPEMLSSETFEKLIRERPDMKEFYLYQDDGFYHLNSDKGNKKYLRDFFWKSSFNALSYTDSRSQYQYYNLAWLWGDIKKVMRFNISILNLATEPILTKDLYYDIYGKAFKNYISSEPLKYDFRTKYGLGYNGTGKSYLYNKERIWADVEEFIRNELLKIH